MYFGLPDEAIALRDGLREVLADACTPPTIREAWNGSTSEALWKQLAEFGLFGLLVPEDRGGLGLDELSFVAAMEECGYAGVPGPLVETVSYLPSRSELPVDGSVRIAVERGENRPTPYAGTATHLVRPGELLTEFAVTPVESVDPSRQLATVTTPAQPIDASRLELISAQEHHEKFGVEPAERAQLGTAAFLLGLARRQVDLTVSYLRERKQFGVQIGSFQGLKHPLADAVVQTEFAWPVVLQAAHSLATHAEDADLRLAHAKSAASDSSYKVSKVCLQAHGAIGYTVEYDLHLFMKRTWAMSKDWGSASSHRHKIAREMGIGGYS